MKIPETRYAKALDGTHLAYKVLGNGPVDLVYLQPWFSHIEYIWEEPRYERFLRTFASFSRLIIFDRRGCGMSDPVPMDRPPDLETRMDDARAVMDDVGSERAVVYGAPSRGCSPVSSRPCTPIGRSRSSSTGRVRETRGRLTTRGDSRESASTPSLHRSSAPGAPRRSCENTSVSPATKRSSANLHWGHRLLSNYLDEAGIAHEHRENPGNHGGRAHERYQVALQWLSQVLDGD